MTITESWKEAGNRIQELRKQLGVTQTRMAERLEEYGYNVTGASLGHNLRGRVPDKPYNLVDSVSLYFADAFSEVMPHLERETAVEAFKIYILGVVPLNPLEPVEYQKAMSRRAEKLKPAHLDLWTPGITASDVASALDQPLEAELIRQIVRLSQNGIAAIGKGDFERQLRISEAAIELGNHHPQSMLLPEGLYLKAEAKRLIADFEPDRDKAQGLRRAAIELYSAAEDALLDDPRPVRGRARTLEVLGDSDEALKGFKAAMSLVESPSDETIPGARYSIAHESIRTLRHKITCLADIHEQMPTHTQESRSRESELRLLLAASFEQHKQNLNLFRDSETWWRIEWFMALVLHAKSYLAIGEMGFAARYLVWALKQRVRMMSYSGALSNVELGNFDWWGRAAKRVESEFTRDQQALLAEITNLIPSGGMRSQLLDLVGRFLKAGEEPWNLSTST